MTIGEMFVTANYIVERCPISHMHLAAPVAEKGALYTGVTRA